MAEFGADDLKVHVTTPNIRVVFYNVLDNFEETDKKSKDFDNGSSYKVMGQLGIDSYFAFSPENPNQYFSGANIQSYSFTNSIDDINGSFSITVKEDTRPLPKGQQYFMDQVKKLDVVEFIENGSVEFYGIVRTISIGATAGAMNKVITISGISAAGLLNMFNISTDVASMAFLQNEGANKKITDRISKLFQQKSKDGVDVAEVFRIVYLAMFYIAEGKTYNPKTGKWEETNSKAPFASFKTQRIFRFIFGVAHDDVKQADGTITYDTVRFSKPVEFLDCNEKFQFQLTSNLFNQNEVNIVSYFKGFMPPPIYEMFHTFDENNSPKIVLREVPFLPTEWANLPIKEIDPSLITDYTLSNTDTNIFTTFYAYAAGAPGNSDLFKNAGARDKNGNPIMKVDGDLVDVYGFIPLDVNFIGWKPRNIKDDSIMTVAGDLSEKVKKYFKNLKDFWNGDVTFVNMLENNEKVVTVYDEKGFANKSKKKISKNPRIGARAKLCGLEFYITSATHTWRYGEPCKINLHLERGGKYYEDGTFIEPKYETNGNKVVNLNPSSLSRTWAELLVKE